MMIPGARINTDSERARQAMREASHWRHEAQRLEVENAHLRKKLAQQEVKVWQGAMDGTR